MGANGDAGRLTIGSPSASFGALHAGTSVQATLSDNLALFRDYPSSVGRVQLGVHREQMDPSSTCTVLTKVDADDLRSGPAVTFSAMCAPAQAFCLSSPQASVATGTPAILRARQPAVGR
jgi:hypothetical protein